MFEPGDYVKHAIFGKWVYIEWYESKCVVRFEKRGNKNTQHSLIELVTPKKITYTNDEILYNETHADEVLLPNDML